MACLSFKLKFVDEVGVRQSGRELLYADEVADYVLNLFVVEEDIQQIFTQKFEKCLR